jgi:hypothetical protein
LAADGTLATFVTVDLGLRYSSRDPAEHQGIFRIRGRLVQLACVDEIAGGMSDEAPLLDRAGIEEAFRRLGDRLA